MGGLIAVFACAAITFEPYDWTMALIFLFFAAVTCGNALGGVLLTPGALLLGQCSFSTYLLHGIVIDLAWRHLLAPARSTEWALLAMPLVAAVVVVFAAGSYLVIESPMMALGRWIAKARRVQPAALEPQVAP